MTHHADAARRLHRAFADHQTAYHAAQDTASALVLLAACHEVLEQFPEATHIHMQEGDQDGGDYMTFWSAIADGQPIEEVEPEPDVSWLTPAWLGDSCAAWLENGSRSQGSHGLLDIAAALAEFAQHEVTTDPMPAADDLVAVREWLERHEKETP